ncbi:hypothetical protein VitviT2T_030102 [Vitis vinifera]|uniref:Disease resistance protein RPM1 n=1 Tax=Vitis vinifera TaxID=29760 RepID=A0ABY9DYM9_VITVI|nr:disease resistance protein RPM1-like [Vitis vinifera]WKA12745.1 hypothetical protein VitviT2T_030102 [Vitis vinifera]|eukprot:XP_010644664.1 PREDICTED: disease resistance protein RPM1-like [Vitis vinifera]
MAEIAVSAALGVVQIFLSQRIPELKQKEVDIGVIKGHLETMRAYLKDIKKREHTEGARDRRNKVQEIAYKIEDALEEFMVDVPEHFHKHKFSQALHDVYHKVMDWRAFPRLSSRINDIQDKIRDIKELDSFRTSSSGVASSSRAEGVPDLAYPILKNDELVGIERRTSDLLDRLMKEASKRLVISVVGASGSGKTILIKKVCESEGVKGHFECHAWVSHSTSCKDTCEKICKEMGVPVPPGGKIEENLVNYLEDKRYLVVLDGGWKEDWCNCINILPDNGNGSRVIFSTCRLDLVSKCSDDFYNLDPLSGNEAWELFCKKAFSGSECPKHLKEISEDLLSNCGGLPLAIVALGSLLSTKSRTPAEFQKVLDSLGHNLERNFEFGIMKRVLEQRYFNLSHNLKRCFLYFCNFPGGYPVTRGRLIRLWIAEGFVEEKGDQALEVADAYLKELISGCLVDTNTWDVQGLVRSCQVNNLVRECLVSISEDERFCKVLTRQNFDEYDHRSNRHIAIHDAFTDSLQSKDFSHVRTLFMFGKENFTASVFGKALERFKFLRVLELKDAPLETFPEEVVNLTLLRYLNLRNTKIKAVPGSVKKLQNLETLDLRQTFVSELPKTIRKVHKLVHLAVDKINEDQGRVGAGVFSGIGVLASLQKLSLIKANKNQRIAEELGNLTAMRKLGITELESRDGKDLCASIQKMKHLSCLHVTSRSKVEVLDLDYMSTPPSLLHRLSLEGKLRATPSWISELHSLVKMSLKSSRLDGGLIEALQDLPCLMELQLVDAFNGKELEFRCNSFQELRKLEVEQSDHLHTVLVHEGAMPNLQKLTMRRCKNLKLAPLGLNNLTRLEEMHLYEMSEELITELDNLRTGEYHWMIDHIQVIHTSCSPVNSTYPRFRNLSSFARY